MENLQLINIIEALRKMIDHYQEKGANTDNGVMSAYYKGYEDCCREIKEVLEDILTDQENRGCGGCM